MRSFRPPLRPATPTAITIRMSILPTMKDQTYPFIGTDRIRSQRFGGSNGFKLAVDFGMIRIQMPGALGILQQSFYVGLSGLQCEHIFRVILTD